MTENSWTTTTIGAAANVVSANEQQPPSTTAASIDVSSTLASVTEAIKSLISSTTTEASNSDAASTPFSSGMNDETTTEANRPSVADLSSSLQHFGIVDYCVFVLMLVVCAVIGFYFGFIEKKSKKRDSEQRRGSEALDYLVGGRKMKVFPVSLSLVASFVSGISLLGTSTEIYVYGTQYAFILITLVISGFISWYVFLPVFCNLQLTSTYEYFEMRYDKSVRLLGSVLFTIGTLIWLPIVIYVPALAFNQVTGINIHIITPVVCVVCIFYTCVGGLKAVVWTDVIQTVVMLGAIALVIVKGTIDVGGLGVVWERNMASGRIEAPTMTLDPTVRVSMLSVFVGSVFFFTQGTAGNQVIMQRYLSVPSLKEAKKCVIFFTAGVTLLTAATFYNGLLIFATYHDCDPLSTKLAKAKDQLVPLLVMDALRVFPGVPGLFVAGVFSAALSSLSTGLNSLSAVFLEDYIKPFLKTPLTERQTAIIMRSTVVIVGTLCTALVLVVEYMGTHVIELSMTLGSITLGPLLSLFLMGLMLPWINARSAISGVVVACVAMTFVCVKGKMALAAGELVYHEKPVSTEGCTYSFEVLTTLANSTAPVLEETSRSFMQYIYHMSFMLYAAVGCIISMISACLATYVWGMNNPRKMDIRLFSPFIQRLLKTTDYVSVQTDQKDDFEKKTDLDHEKLNYKL